MTTLRAGWLDRWWVTALFGLVVAILTWDRELLTPAPGLDQSWVLGLNLAAAMGLDHGTELVFTYGPLGFLEEPLVIDGTLATIAAVYLLALRAALAASLLWAARQSFGWPAAAVLAVAVAAIAPRVAGSVPLALTTVWCLIALQGRSPRWTGRLVLIGGGVLAALEILVKLNVGVTILALVLVTTLALGGGRLRNLLILLGVFTGAATVLWLVSGQGVGNVDDYVASAFEIVSGYSEAMQSEAAPVSWDWAAALLVGLATLGATAYASAGAETSRRIGMLLVVGLLLFSLAKFAFVRHEAGAVGAFFEGACVVWLALRWQGVGRLAPVAALILIALAYFPAARGAAEFEIRPGAAIDQLRTLLIPGDRERAAETARAELRAAYGVDPRIIRRIGGQPVDVRPWEIGLIWAYDLNWRPLPVIQDYTAYTPALDQLNAETLESEDGPRFVLRHFGFANSAAIGIEGRFTSFDAPRQTQVLLCRFRPELTVAPYQLLVRGRDRCGPERPLGAVTAAYGELVPVPEARSGEAVFARIEGAHPQGIERLRTLAYRAAIRRIRLDGASAPLPARNAAGGLLLALAPEADLTAPFALAPNAATIAIESDGGFATSDEPVRIEFYAVAVKGEPTAPR